MNEQKKDLTFFEFVSAAKKHVVWICLSIVMGGVLLGGLTLLLSPPQYQASGMVYVYNETRSDDLLTSSLLLLETRETLLAVQEQTGTGYTLEQLEEMVTGTALNENSMFRFTVTAHDPQEAAAIAQALAGLLPQRIAALIPGTTVQIADAPAVPSKPAGPNYLLRILIGCLLGLLTSTTVIALRTLRQKES